MRPTRLEQFSSAFGRGASSVMPRMLAAAFVLSLGSIPAWAGPGGSSIAEREIARREGRVQQAKELIAEGDAARKAKNFAAAVTAYRRACEVLPLSPATLELRARALHAFSEVSVVHAEMLAMEARYEEANEVLDAVLLPDWNPEYKPALKLKQQIQDPEYFNPADSPAHHDKVSEVDRLLRLAEGHFNLGEFDLAAEHFNRVLAIDRYNVAARRGLEKVERRISQHHQASRDHTRAAMLRAVDEQWETAVPMRLRPEYGAASHPAMGGSPISDRVPVREKIRTLIAPRVQLVDATLDEALQYIVMQSRELDTAEPDPEKRGINVVRSGDPVLGNRRVSLMLENVPLEYVLESLARQAQTEMRVDDFLVTIGPADPTGLETRTYRVPPSFFTASAPTVSGGGDPFSTDGSGSSSGLSFVRLSAQDILSQNGVSFPEGAAASYSAVTGLLTVRNTPSNHEMIRTIIENAAATAPKMVRLQCTMIEVNQENTEELGFDWLLGQFNVGGNAKVFGGGGTTGNQPGLNAQNYPFVPPYPDAKPVGEFPLTAGNRSGYAAITPNSIDSLIAGQRGADLSLKAPGVFGLAGVYTDVAFQTVLRGLSQKKGVDVLSTPEVLTKSGHRARVEVVREFIYPTEFEPPEIPQDFSTGGGGGGFNILNLNIGQLGQLPGLQGGGSVGGAFPVTPTMPTTFETVKLGHVFEVEATVGPDNRTIDVDVTPSYSDFEGFVNYGTPIQTYVSGSQAPLVLTQNEIPQPVFKFSRSDGPIKVTMYSGATMVIAALNMEETQSVEDKTPILGDLPFLGQFFRTQAQRVRKKAVVFSLKATVVDPTGETPPETPAVVAGGQ